MNLASELYYIEYNNIIIGVISILPFPTGNTKYIFRIHRLVILPDYQNLCIGSKLLDLIGEYYINQGKKLFITTIHERIHNHCKKLKLYRETNSNKHTRHTVSSLPQFKNAFLNRKTYSYEYVGSDYYNKLHKIIIADKDEILDEKELIELKKQFYLVVFTGDKDIRTSNNELLCQKLGIRTELLYISKNKKRNIVELIKNYMKKK